MCASDDSRERWSTSLDLLRGDGIMALWCEDVDVAVVLEEEEAAVDVELLAVGACVDDGGVAA